MDHNKKDGSAGREEITNRYRSPLEQRYASKQMLYLFSSEWKYQMWRRLWLYLAEAEQDLGLAISDAALGEMREALGNIDWARVRFHEQRLHHDVMAHVYTFGEAAPEARGIIHLGATSAYVVDNTDIIEMREGLQLVGAKILAVMKNLMVQAKKYQDDATLGYTHFQPAQPTTIGRRLTLYLQELLLDLEELTELIETLPLRGVKGATGTQASFLTLFDGDHEKVEALDQRIAQKCGFKKVLKITGQTSTRKLDYRVAAWLSGVAQTASKFANDMRLWQHKGEVAEPFGDEQIGSSAMPFKRNPMQAERISSLARFVMALPMTFAYTASTQWFERSLDDSANRRISMPEAFLAIDSILELMRNITAGLRVDTKRALDHLRPELPFMTLETLMMRAVREHGKDRQELHDKTRSLSLALHEKIRRKEVAHPDEPLLDIMDDLVALYGVSAQEIRAACAPQNFIGRSSEQVTTFISTVVEPAIRDAEQLFRVYGGERLLGEPEIKV